MCGGLNMVRFLLGMMVLRGRVHLFIDCLSRVILSTGKGVLIRESLIGIMRVSLLVICLMVPFLRMISRRLFVLRISV